MEKNHTAIGNKHARADSGGKKRAGRLGGKILLILAVLLFLSGTALLTYPAVTRTLYRLEAESVNAAFAERMAQARREQPGEQDALYEKMVQYNQELYRTGQSGLVDAFSYEQVGFRLRAVGLREVMVGHLSITN